VTMGKKERNMAVIRLSENNQVEDDNYYIDDDEDSHLQTRIS
jgi:hypothetical protein